MTPNRSSAKLTSVWYRCELCRAYPAMVLAFSGSKLRARLFTKFIRSSNVVGWHLTTWPMAWDQKSKGLNSGERGVRSGQFSILFSIQVKWWSVFYKIAQSPNLEARKLSTSSCCINQHWCLDDLWSVTCVQGGPGHQQYPSKSLLLHPWPSCSQQHFEYSQDPKSHCSSNWELGGPQTISPHSTRPSQVGKA